MLNLNSIMIGTERPKELTFFYEKVFVKKPDMTDGDWSGFQVGACFFSIGKHDKVHGQSTNPERLILIIEAKDVRVEFARIKELGAKVVAEPYQMGEGDHQPWIATFADPDGNYFQLMSPWE